MGNRGWGGGGVLSGRLEACEATAHTEHGKRGRPSISGGWRKGGGWVGEQNTTISVCVAIVRWTSRLCAAASLTPFSGSQDRQPLPGGGQQSGPLGRNFSIQSAKRSECLSGTSKNNNAAAFISFYINHTCKTGRQHVNRWAVLTLTTRVSVDQTMMEEAAEMDDEAPDDILPHLLEKTC